jgi:hydrogenase expression/formation protein HypD
MSLQAKPMPNAQEWLAKIRALPLPDKVRVMNVCGGHERSISMAGLRKALPANIELIPGPGCPVCVCPEQDIYLAMIPTTNIGHIKKRVFSTIERYLHEHEIDWQQSQLYPA